VKCIADRGPQIILSTREGWGRGAENVGGRNVHVHRGPSKGSTPPTTGLPLKLREPGLTEGKGGWSSRSALANFDPHPPGRGRGPDVRSAPHSSLREGRRSGLRRQKRERGRMQSAPSPGGGWAGNAADQIPAHPPPGESTREGHPLGF